MIDKIKIKSAFVPLLVGSVGLSLHVTRVVLQMYSFQVMQCSIRIAYLEDVHMTRRDVFTPMEIAREESWVRLNA